MFLLERWYHFKKFLALFLTFSLKLSQYSCIVCFSSLITFGSNNALRVKIYKADIPVYFFKFAI
jgi:hypothetical protein